MSILSTFCSKPTTLSTSILPLSVWSRLISSRPTSETKFHDTTAVMEKCNDAVMQLMKKLKSEAIIELN